MASKDNWCHFIKCNDFLFYALRMIYHTKVFSSSLFYPIYHQGKARNLSDWSKEHECVSMKKSWTRSNVNQQSLFRLFVSSCLNFWKISPQYLPNSDLLLLMSSIFFESLAVPQPSGHRVLTFLLSSKKFQVQEKKVKKVCSMNLDPAKAVGNGPVVSPSMSISPKAHMANGGCGEKSFGCSSNDFSFPSDGLSSLHLPVVVVLV